MSLSAVPHTRDPEQKREAILDAALALFSDRGFHGTAVPEVAERAKVAAGTIYRYFPSKEALVNAVYQREKEAIATTLLCCVSPELPPRGQLHQFFQAACDFALKNPMALAFLELHHHQEYLDDKSRALEQMMLEPALAFVRHAQEQLAMKRLDPSLLVCVVWGIFTGLVRAHNEKRITLNQETIAAAEECCWQAIRA